MSSPRTRGRSPALHRARTTSWSRPAHAGAAPQFATNLMAAGETSPRTGLFLTGLSTSPSSGGRPRTSGAVPPLHQRTASVNALSPHEGLSQANRSSSRRPDVVPAHAGLFPLMRGPLGKGQLVSRDQPACPTHTPPPATNLQDLNRDSWPDVADLSPELTCGSSDRYPLRSGPQGSSQPGQPTVDRRSLAQAAMLSRQRRHK